MDDQSRELPHISSETVLMIREVHNNLGHLSTSLMIKILREAGATSEVLESVKAFKCEISERPKTHPPSRSAATVCSSALGMVIVVDACLWKHPVSNVYSLKLKVIDEASRFHVASSSNLVTAHIWEIARRMNW